MRLLKCSISEDDKVEIALEHFLDSEVPPYAILSHRWVGIMTKSHFRISSTMLRITERSLAIPKSLTVAVKHCVITALCYAYLNDVSSDEDPEDRNSSFRRSEWFTRGWTLQELIAPTSIVFFAKDWMDVGSKKSLANVVSDITNVERSVLLRMVYLDISVAKRMSWAANRKTSRIEDRAYSLIGLFGVSLPIIYGEGERSFMRLQMEIIKTSNDQSIFAWEDSGRFSQQAFAYSVDQFSGCSDYSSTPIGSYLQQPKDGTCNIRMDYSLTNYGLCIRLPLYQAGYGGIFVACLSCVNSAGQSCYIYLQSSLNGLPNHYMKLTIAGKSVAYRETTSHAVSSFHEIFIAQRDPSRLVMMSPINFSKNHQFIIRKSGFEDLRYIGCSPACAWRENLVFELALDYSFNSFHVAILFKEVKSEEIIAVFLGIDDQCFWSYLVVKSKPRGPEAIYEDYLLLRASPKYSIRAQALDWIKKPRTIPGTYVVLTTRRERDGRDEQHSRVDISAR
ncbi:HET domain-containing protein [Rutstroemia sp. NJR-2017a WRK4]|nr:HET domain-containing protein [Rutstroemia sp. NJR-2017a WRK4]